MFGRKQPEMIEIETRVCKYCSSNKIQTLETASGFGGGAVRGSNYDKIYFCEECGKITNADQFKRRFEEKA